MLLDLQKRYRNDHRFYDLVNVFLYAYQQTGQSPTRMVCGNAMREILDPKTFVDAVKLAKHMSGYEYL